ncbi:unnamed protein product [Dracunculus medinensis]|uniref:non-specific protein-tyrosine kinase n=1 Tax=Dracunculus medinensis TaxID=318479 RepID=A0A0N4UBG1_DRAME|nr:unnamed protein product [Dracunculus medinensis]
MTAECREVRVPNKEADLEMILDDRIIVIDGSDHIWYGQNVRTRKFGHFYRSCIYAKSNRSGEPNSANFTSGMISENNHNDKISKPIPGSFIHAGHGDINPSQSWGQPDRIDDIYLKNPILRKEKEIFNENSRRRIGPEIIPSIIDVSSRGQSVVSALNAGSGNRANESPNLARDKSLYSVDPFAPFSEYSYEVFNGHVSENVNQTASNPNLLHPSSFDVYDQPPVAVETHVDGLIDSVKNKSNPSQLSVSATVSMHPSENIVKQESPTLANNSKNAENYYLLRRPQSSVVLNSIKSSSSSRFSSSLTPPPIRSINYYNRAENQMLKSEDSSRNLSQDAIFSSVSSENCRNYIGSVISEKADETKISQRPYDIAENIHSICNFSDDQSRINSTNSSVNVEPTPSSASSLFHSSNVCSLYEQSCSATTSVDIAERKEDPFEVPLVVKNIANRDRYSQMFMNTSNDLNSTPMMANCFSYSNPECTTNTPVAQSSYRVPFFWQPPSQSTNPANNLLTSIGTTPTLVYDAQLSAKAIQKQQNSPRNINFSVKRLSVNESTSGEILQPKSSQLIQRKSFINDEVLCMFDPLVSLQSTVNKAEGQNCLEIVMKGATFAGRERCEQMLFKCQNDSAQAIRELKIDELMCMGVAKNRSLAKIALEDCRWNLNDAAAALIS